MHIISKLPKQLSVVEIVPSTSPSLCAGGPCLVESDRPVYLGIHLCRLGFRYRLRMTYSVRMIGHQPEWSWNEWEGIKSATAGDH